MSKKYKGFSKLPEAVQKKMDPNLAEKYMHGGAVKEYGHGGSVEKDSNGMSRGCGAAISGKKFIGVK